MSRILLLVSVLAVAGASKPANELRKCVGANGAVSYQDQPCAPGAREAWAQPVKAMTPPPVATETPARVAPARARAAPVRVPAKRVDPRRARCDEARREADETRDRLWNKLSFQERSDLDAKVARACAR